VERGNSTTTKVAFDSFILLDDSIIGIGGGRWVPPPPPHYCTWILHQNCL